MFVCVCAFVCVCVCVYTWCTYVFVSVCTLVCVCHSVCLHVDSVNEPVALHLPILFYVYGSILKATSVNSFHCMTF